MHTVFAWLCFVVVIHWLIFPYPPGLLHWHCGNLTIAPVPAKQPWWIWINTSCEFIMNDYITTTKQSTTKPCAYFLGYTVMKSIYKQLSGVRQNTGPNVFIIVPVDVPAHNGTKSSADTRLNMISSSVSRLLIISTACSLIRRRNWNWPKRPQTSSVKKWREGYCVSPRNYKGMKIAREWDTHPCYFVILFSY